MNEKVDVEIARRRLSIEIEGLTAFEIHAIAASVDEKIKDVEASYPKVADTSKLAIYAALELATELYKLQQAQSTNHNALENTIDRITGHLQETLTAVGAPAEAVSE